MYTVSIFDGNARLPWNRGRGAYILCLLFSINMYGYMPQLSEPSYILPLSYRKAFPNKSVFAWRLLLFQHFVLRCVYIVYTDERATCRYLLRRWKMPAPPALYIRTSAPASMHKPCRAPEAIWHGIEGLTCDQEWGVSFYRQIGRSWEWGSFYAVFNGGSFRWIFDTLL